MCRYLFIISTNNKFNYKVKNIGKLIIVKLFIIHSIEFLN